MGAEWTLEGGAEPVENVKVNTGDEKTASEIDAVWENERKRTNDTNHGLRSQE